MTTLWLQRWSEAHANHWPRLRRAAALLISGGALVWLAMCAVGYLLTQPLTHEGFTTWEGGLDRWFAGHRRAGWNTVTNVASIVGDTPAAIGLSVVAFISLRLAVHRWREPIFLAVSMVGEVAIFSATAATVGRPRPTVKHLDGSPPTSSFPSGHTAASTTLYGVLVVVVFAYCGRALWRALAVVAATTVVGAIGMSRLYRGMHYPSDVAGGIVLGLLWISVTTAVMLHDHERRQAGGSTRTELNPASRWRSGIRAEALRVLGFQTFGRVHSRQILLLPPSGERRRHREQPRRSDDDAPDHVRDVVHSKRNAREPDQRDHNCRDGHEYRSPATGHYRQEDQNKYPVPDEGGLRVTTRE
jgi:membrane-associated phospholipid phosphatase